MRLEHVCSVSLWPVGQAVGVASGPLGWELCPSPTSTLLCDLGKPTFPFLVVSSVSC